jgi:DNA/RNA endonuclease YhcR with UshA esterase domain
MRFAAATILVLLPALVCHAQEAARPITPEEALKRVDQKVTVAMEVKSAGGNTARYLNSETDFRANTNFAIFIPNIALAGFKQAGVADPGEFYKGKTIIVTGTVALAQGRPQIRVENVNQIKVVGNNPAPAAVRRPVAPNK